MKDAKTTEAGVSSREKEKKAAASGWSSLDAIRSWPAETKTFLQDVRSETKRVTWPTAKQIRATTVVVLLTVFFFGVYFGILDWIYSTAVAWLIRLAS